MKGIYVIAITCLAFWTDNVIAAKEDQLDQLTRANEIPIRCPYPGTGNPNVTVHLAHESDCKKFYKCSWGKRYEMDCPPMDKDDPSSKLHFNRLLQVCDWPWQAGCSSCPPKDENGQWPRSNIPSERKYDPTYYECINGRKNLRYCPRNKYFSRTCQTCVVHREGGNCDF